MLASVGACEGNVVQVHAVGGLAAALRNAQQTPGFDLDHVGNGSVIFGALPEVPMSMLQAAPTDSLVCAATGFFLGLSGAGCYFFCFIAL